MTRNLIYLKKKTKRPRPNSNVYQNIPDFTLPLAKPVRKCLENLSYLSPKIWKILSFDLKQTEFLLGFKANIKNWNP